MKNIRNRVNLRLVNGRKKVLKLAAKPNFKHRTIFDQNVVAFHMEPTTLVFDKPVYCGMNILNMMYDFYYNYIEKKYGQKAKLLFPETDSLMNKTETEVVEYELKMSSTQAIASRITCQGSQLGKIWRSWE